MNWGAAEAIARAVLYEGYLLYPYRPTALKNRRRSMFGTVEADGSPGPFAEVLVDGGPETRLVARLRFLQESPGDVLECEVATREFPLANGRHPFSFPPAAGRIEVCAERIRDGRFKLRIAVENEGHAPLLSAHVLLGVAAGVFVSNAEATGCNSRGLWPVLVGTPPDRSLLLLSPVLLEDYPSIAPESPRDLFDLTEIDEILGLRVRTLSDSEKEEIRRGDPRACELLRHVEALSAPEQIALHGAARRGPAVGDRVRLRPQGRADIMDLALAGKEATVVAVEEDMEGRRYVAVTIADDPGSDLGERGFLGHRFFFRPEEVVLL